jgi:membrane associated rhomboid family serine protease
MIPIRDENPTRRVPIVNYMLLGLNALVWLWQVMAEQSGFNWLTAAYGLVPRRFLGDPGGEAFTIVMSMFMHGGWAHVGGNMLFLFVFGDNVEDALGRGRYLIFYVASGLAAATAQVFVDPTSTIPMVGASGAIAGVLGGYMVLFPRAPITVLNPVFPLWFLLGPFLVFPAWLVMGEWFLVNFFAGTSALSQAAMGGVAVFAHIGGFLAGLLLVKPMRPAQITIQRRSWEGFRTPPRPPGLGGGSWGGSRGWPGGTRGRPGRWF